MIGGNNRCDPTATYPQRAQFMANAIPETLRPFPTQHMINHTTHASLGSQPATATSAKSMNQPRRVPSLKRFLYEVYCDLSHIDTHLIQYADYPNELSVLERAVLVLEDRRFFQHRGIDLRSALREMARMVTLRRFGGASTIEMQFVRTCTGYRKRTLRRKLYEMLLALAVCYRASKLQVLRSYLNIVFLGSHIKGTRAAARVMYGVREFSLSPEQAATIAAMMVYPRPLAPTPRWHERVQRRAQYALRLLPKVPLIRV